MSSQLAPYGVSQHDLLHLSSNLLPTLHVPQKAPVSMESNADCETEKSEQFLLRRVRSSSPSGQKEQKSPCQPLTAAPQPLGSHDLNRQPQAESASWAERLCHTNFFSPCAHHSSKVYRRCEVCHSSCAHSRGAPSESLDHVQTWITYKFSHRIIVISPSSLSSNHKYLNSTELSLLVTQARLALTHGKADFLFLCAVHTLLHGLQGLWRAMQLLSPRPQQLPHTSGEAFLYTSSCVIHCYGLLQLSSERSSHLRRAAPSTSHIHNATSAAASEKRLTNPLQRF